MSTITYTLPAQRIEYVVGTDDIRSVGPSTLSFVYDIDAETVSYTILSREEDDLAEVDFTPDALDLVIDGVSVTELEQQGFEFSFYFGQLNWSNGVSYLLDVEQEPPGFQFGDSGFDYVIVVGGVPLPQFGSVSELGTFLLANEGNLSEVSPTNTFGPGRDIVLADVPGVQIERTIDPEPEPEPEPEGPTEGPDVLTGTDGPDEIDGLGGNDTIQGGAGNDTLLGNAGNDRLEGREGNDSLDGGAGNDTVFGDAGDDVLIDGAGNDLLRGGVGNDTIINVSGADTFLGDGGRDLMITDVTGLDPEGNVLRVDLLAGRHGRRDSDIGQDTLGSIEDFTGIGSWDMELIGDGTANRLESGSGNDTLTGNGGADTLVGGDGGDVYFADDADTIIELPGGTGIDELRVTGNATLDVDGIEQLTAIGRQNIRLDGTAGDEILAGNAGANILVGFGGEDTMTGGAGADTFVLTALRGTDPNVSVTDWSDGDRLAIDDQLLGLGRGRIDIRDLTPEVFRDVRDSGAVGYNSRTGELRLDIDGDGDRELVATLEGGARLGLDDILLF